MRGDYLFSLEGRPIIPRLTCPICGSEDCFICKGIKGKPVIRCRNEDCKRMTVCEYDINQGVMGMPRINHSIRLQSEVDSVSCETQLTEHSRKNEFGMIIDKSRNFNAKNDTKFQRMAEKIFELTSTIDALETQLSTERLANRILQQKV